MAYPLRSVPSHSRGASTSGQSPALQARIEEKKTELENLKELRDLSAAVATQMESLESKLSTLSDGTEAIAAVVGNWHNVLRAINMASTKLAKTASDTPSDEQQGATEPLPQTLVRIPTEHAPALQAQAEAAEAAAQEEEE
ncbi:Fc.00g007850.m01.CDS01 [Cosmosporella sp. VM-42]